MADSFFNIKTFFCYDPETIKHGIGSSANGRSVKDDFNNLYACISQAQGRDAKIDYLAKGRQVILGDIEFKVWRKQPTHFTELDDGNAYACAVCDIYAKALENGVVLSMLWMTFWKNTLIV